MVVLTSEFVELLKDYQKARKFPITGLLGYQTLSSQSDNPSWELLTLIIDEDSLKRFEKIELPEIKDKSPRE